MPRLTGTPGHAKLRRLRLATDFVDKVFESHNPVALANRFLNSKDDKVALAVFLKLLAYKLGEPPRSDDPDGQEEHPPTFGDLPVPNAESTAVN